MIALLDGFSLGLAYAMPIGALNVFVLQSAMGRSGRPYQTALAVTLMDVTLGLACYLGVGAVFAWAPVLKPLLLLFGVFFLLRIGLRLLREKETATVDADGAPRMARSIWKSALILTWMNPHAVIDGTLLLGGARASVASPEWFLTGALLALPVWYFSIVLTVRVLRERFSPRIFLFVQRGCGAVLVYFGVKFAAVLVGMWWG